MNRVLSSTRFRLLGRLAAAALCAIGALLLPSAARAELRDRAFIGTFTGDFAQIENYFSISGATDHSSSSGSLFLEKTVSSSSSISIFAGLQRLQSDGEGASGWNNVEMSFKQNLISFEHAEFVLSINPNIELPTGSRGIGSESHPRGGFELLFAKGMGDLPEGVAWLKPAALEGGASWQGKLTGAQDDLLSGFAELEYSFHYLAYQVGGIHVNRALCDFTPHLDFDYFQYLSAHRNSTAPSFELTPGLAWMNSVIEVNVGAQVGLNHIAAQQGSVAFVWLLGISYDELVPILKWTPLR